MPNVLCVTLNPCLDKTLTVPEWKPGDNVRGTAIREVVGGKGNNVARALFRLGLGARPVTFFGGATGQRCQWLLRSEDGLDPLTIESESETRTILTVRTGETACQTAFFDPDPLISADEARLMLDEVEKSLRASEVRALTLSGSSPSRWTHSIYAELIDRARTAGVPVLLDTYGPALRETTGRAPDVVQLNRKEIAGALEMPENELTQAVMLNWLQGWVSKGVRLAVVTQGAGDVLAASPDGFWCVSVPRVVVVNPVGSGDCMLAGLCFGVLGGWPVPAVLRYGVACGVANAEVWDAGGIDPQRVFRITEMTVPLRLT